VEDLPGSVGPWGSQREARDELGIGFIRDAISNVLFPGTSTIQTKLKYFLFVARIYNEIENKARAGALERPYSALENTERICINRIAEKYEGTGETGVFGRISKNIKRLPSSVYWNGLEKWGILS